MNKGDYVRLNCTVYDTVVINRIAEIFDNTILTENDGSMYQGEYSKEEIIKSSPNIIDLIEVGDYVNGSYIYSIVKENKNTGQPRVLFTEEDGVLGSGEIKSILTHEQFSSMEYKVESEVK